MSYERKIINDPVFGFINIPKGLLYDLVRAPILRPPGSEVSAPFISQFQCVFGR